MHSFPHHPEFENYIRFIMHVEYQYKHTAYIKLVHELGFSISRLDDNEVKIIELIKNEINRSSELYKPSVFWETIGEYSDKYLSWGGPDNFKRTLNQVYLNFIPSSILSPIILTNINKLLHVNILNIHKYKIEDPDNDNYAWFSLLDYYYVFKKPFRKLKLFLYKLMMIVLYENIRNGKTGPLLKYIEEPKLGNPIIFITPEGKIGSQDIVNSLQEYDLIKTQYEKTYDKRNYVIGELGAGYGRLAYVYKKLTNCRYLIFDIMPALYISQWYFKNLDMKLKIFEFRPDIKSFEEIESELELADIAFFTPNQLELFIDNYFDVFINISSLHEMRREQIKNYLYQINKVTNGMIYLKEYKEYHNPYDNLVICRSDYNITNNHNVLLEKTNDINYDFFELIIDNSKSDIEKQICNNVEEVSVTIVMSNYNHAKYLDESLSGIVNQTRKADQIIILDDGSTDHSIDIINRYVDEHDNVRCIKNRNNKGLMFSIDKLIRHCRTDYVVWASADDYLMPNFIEKNLSLLTKYPKAGIVFSRLSTFVNDKNNYYEYTEKNHLDAFDYTNIKEFNSPQEIDERLMEDYLWISSNTVLMRRDALLEVGGFIDKLEWHADWFTVYVIALRYGACVIPETLALMREHKSTYSSEGISKVKSQTQVVSSILKCIKSPQFKDVSSIFRARPCLLSVFGKNTIYAAMKNPLYWDILLQYLNWILKRKVKASTNEYIVNNNIKVYCKFIFFNSSQRILNSFIPNSWNEVDFDMD